MSTKSTPTCKKQDASNHQRKNENISCNWKTLLKKMQESPEAKKSTVRKKFGKKRLKHDKSKSPEIWFDDVDESEIHGEVGSPPQKKPRKNETTKVELVTGKCTEPTRYVALDCEMVGTGYEGEDSMLARCSLVNRFGHVLYDKYVAPQEWVTDFRTKYSGIRVQDVRSEKAEEFSVVQKEVSDLLQGRILVGHALRNDLKVSYPVKTPLTGCLTDKIPVVNKTLVYNHKEFYGPPTATVLLLDHPKKNIRDTAKYPPFKKHTGGRTPSLKKLAKAILNIDIQDGEHCSVEDSQVAMKIYVMHSREWEKAIKTGGLRKLKAKPTRKRKRKPHYWRNKRK